MKIGNIDVIEDCLSGLDKTNVPLPFECELALEVEDECGDERRSPFIAYGNRANSLISVLNALLPPCS